MQKARLFLRDIWPDPRSLESIRQFAEIENTIKADVRRLDQELSLQYQAVSQAQSLIHNQEQCQKQWDNTLTSIGLPSSNDFSEIDAETDKLVRFKIFLLTTHYWEGRWLLEMENNLPAIEQQRGKTGRKTIEARWRRRMMLTPCAVSTLAMLPQKLRVRQCINDVYSDDYLYNYIDLLIIDEAGQVLPEVAGASFTLAKKAIVIGDTRQIEPIWAISQRVDLGNLLGSGIIEGEISEDGWERLKTTGKLASSGSVMQVAQHACRYHYDPQMERGFYLYEHHRCLTEIINYCNELSYQGKLLPKRIPDTKPPFPPMAYLHIHGFCRTSGTSRVNHLEAETIALWLAENKQVLEQHYGQNIENIVGVVTPFAAQSRTIINACHKQNIAAGTGKNDITVGTVHALQGAERAIILFSSVYSKHEDGNFIDLSKSMLNVAVSRAKDSFLLFGDMDVFASASPGTSRGLLASYMFARKENALPFSVPARGDLQDSNSELIHLQNAEEHDQFLLHSLKLNARDIHIVSPWIKLKPLQQFGFLKAFQEAVQRGTRISVYIDPELNADNRMNGASLSYNYLNFIRKALTNIGVTIVYVRKMHSKIVIIDKKILSVGSFNWLSADRNGEYTRHETSLVYKGNVLNNEIKTIQESLEQRKTSEPVFPDE
ncbi:AAA domain-containing protein [Pseudochrobactrum kiredjianiae]|uniref:Phospholipase D n=1 Tax=Pseudochrobactrum kiredjianiae TaxID=386305 RepID=A0ABW3V981_9HYPH